MEATVWLEPLLYNPDYYIPCCSMVSKSRLVLMLIRASVCAEERHELFSHMWRWLALGVLRLGWRLRLFGLMRYRLHMIKHYGRLRALPDDDGEETPLTQWMTRNGVVRVVV